MYRLTKELSNFIDKSFSLSSDIIWEYLNYLFHLLVNVWLLGSSQGSQDELKLYISVMGGIRSI